MAVSVEEFGHESYLYENLNNQFFNVNVSYNLSSVLILC